MTALPVSYYLKELSGDPSRRGGRIGMFGMDDAELDLHIKDTYERGVAEGRAAAQAEHEAAAVAQAAAFEQRLKSERQRWADEEGARLGGLIAATIGDIEQRIADTVSEVLKPVLREQVRARAVEELSRSLNDLLSKGDCAKVTISGPEDLLAAMEGRLSGSHPGLSFVAAEGADVTVSADETVLASRIGAWADVIGGSAA